MPKAKTSGTVWTEEQIKSRWDRVKLSLQPGYKARLEALSKAAGVSMGALVQGWIDSASRAAAENKPPQRNRQTNRK
jgi:hypothetical protein